MEWILDIERGCITENSEPVLESSFDDSKSIEALILASKAPNMLNLLKEILYIQEEKYGDGSALHLAMINKAKEIKQLIESFDNV